MKESNTETPPEFNRAFEDSGSARVENSNEVFGFMTRQLKKIGQGIRRGINVFDDAPEQPSRENTLLQSVDESRANRPDEMVRSGSSAKTVVFCTAFVLNNDDKYYSWPVRYRIWVEAIRRSELQYDQIVLVDDGSQTLPDWSDVTVINADGDLRCEHPLVVCHFENRLGRNAISDFPGWVRSFFFMSHYAEVNHFSKVVHLEADAFLITPQAADYVNSVDEGWTAFWCPRFQRPESGIQIIAGSGLETYKSWASKPVDYFTGAVIENTLPFSSICRDLEGDRYGEDEGRRIPRSADWCMQAGGHANRSYEDFFWWMPWFSEVFPASASVLTEPEIIWKPSSKLSHDGMYYLQLLKEVDSLLEPKSYFEIGTHTGSSLKMIGCDAVCVDPNFAIASNTLLRRRNTHFFQGTSDEFFFDTLATSRLFPAGIDLAFLDGLHLYEALMRDFIHTERLSNTGGMIVLHDCLPLNERMAERGRSFGDETEPQGIRDFWTGDVWKLIVILIKYRPDLCLSYLDCGPTGLVICTRLNSRNVVLSQNYDLILNEFDDLTLSSFGLDRLWDLLPTYNSTQIVANRTVFNKALFRV